MNAEHIWIACEERVEELWVEKKEQEWWTVRVVMMGEMSLDSWDQKSEKKNDQY